MGKIDLTKLSDYYALAVESFYNQKTERNLQLCISNVNACISLNKLLKSDINLSEVELLSLENKLKTLQKNQLSDWHIGNAEMRAKLALYLKDKDQKPFWFLWYEIANDTFFCDFQISVDDTGVFNYQLSIQQESF